MQDLLQSLVKFGDFDLSYQLQYRHSQNRIKAGIVLERTVLVKGVTLCVPLNDEVNGISSKIMFVMQKEEVQLRYLTDITLKDVGINPFFDRVRTKAAARRTRNASLVKQTVFKPNLYSQFSVRLASFLEQLADLIDKERNSNELET